MLIEKTQTGNKFHGQALGIVKKINEDGTYKVWIPGIYAAEFITDIDKLPNARLLYPPFLGDKMDYSFGGPLLEGTKVFCFFDNGEISKPIIIGKFLSDETYQATALENQNTLDRQVSVKIGKSKLILKESGEIDLFVLPSNEGDANPLSKIVMDSSGNIMISGKDVSINASANLSLGGLTVDVNSTAETTLCSGTEIITDSNSLRMDYQTVVKAENKTLRNLYKKTLNKWFKNYQRILAGWWW